MTIPGITLIGLGPGAPELMTIQAWQALQAATELYVRATGYPALARLPESVAVCEIDPRVDDAGELAALPSRIAEQVLSLGQRPQGVTYVTPGHPLQDDAAAVEIYRRAIELGISVQVIPGLGLSTAALDALTLGSQPQITMIAAQALAGWHVPPFPSSAPAFIRGLDSPALVAGIQQVLLSVYPPDHPVYLMHPALRDLPFEIEELPLAELHSSALLGVGSSLYLPTLGADTSFEAFQEIIAHLRAPDGCPWDREQTHQTLRTHLLEETYEVLAALDADSPAEMREEFGDLLLQVVLHAQIASEYGEFNMAEVLESIHTKLVRRHPHVFGDVEVKDAQGVLRNWERLKAEERQANGKAEASLLDGVASALPALLQAEQY